jgi:surfactin synthase thioesterase subunit
MEEVAEPWFAASPVRPEAQAVLFCLPYAGGGASAFAAWRRVFPVSVAVEPVRLPGREQRLDDPPGIDPVEVTDAVLARAGGRPWAVYGHSLGGWVAFELVREVRRRGGPMPARLYVGGCRPPHLADPLAELAALPDEAFLERLVDLGDTPAEAVAVPELRELLLPMLRSDFQWLRSYAYHDEPPLPTPIVAFAGSEDGVVAPEVMNGWERHTSAGFTLHLLPGDHLFLRAAATRLAELVTADLRTGPSTWDRQTRQGREAP